MGAAPSDEDAFTASRRRALLWIAFGLVVGVATLSVLLALAGLAVDPFGDPPVAIGLVAAVAARLTARRLAWRYARAIGDCAEYYLIFVAVALMGAVASYPVSALTRGYSDHMLQSIDAALGFDWVAWYRVVAASPTLQFLGTAAYRSIYISPALLLAWFARTGERAQAYWFIATFLVAAIITLTVFSFMPAVGPLSYLWHGPIGYMPESELWQPDLIPRLRAHTVHIIDLGHLRGLVSAPSFHAAAAVIYAATAWRIPRLRWPLLALNTAMLLSTPVEGTHYFVDILLGMVVACVAIGAVHLAFRRLARSSTPA